MHDDKESVDDAMNTIQPDNETDTTEVRKPRRRNIFLRILKWLSVTLLVILLLIVAAVSLVVYMLTPEQLTPLVEKYASEYLEADVHVGRVELTYWSSWPRLELRVDSLEMDSRSLDAMPDSLKTRLPEDAAHLMSLRRLQGGVHILNFLTTGDIDLYDVAIEGPSVNLVKVDDRWANYNIVPPSPEKKEEPSPLPPISLDRFRLIDCGPLRYVSLADSLDIEVRISDIDLDATTMPTYSLTVETDLKSSLVRDYNIDHVVIGFDGKVEFDLASPARIGVRDFTLGIGVDDDLRVEIAADVVMTDSVVVNAMTVKADDMSVAAIMRHLPPQMKGMLKGLDTDMRFTANAALTEPYVVGDSLTIPSMDVSLDIPACRVYYQNARFNRFRLLASGHIDGDNLNASTLSVKDMLVRGRAIELSVSGEFRSLLFDPYIDATLRGRLRMSALPRVLTSRIPYDIRGTIGLSNKVRMRLSQLTAARFHKIHCEGKIHLSDFEVTARDSSLTAFVGDAMLTFGTHSRIEGAEAVVDSLLTVSLDVDTIHFDSEGMLLDVGKLHAGLGSANRRESSDRHAINPFGGRITMDRLRFSSEADSMRLRIRELDCKAMLRRFEGDGRNPRLDLDVASRRISFGNYINRISITRPHFTLSANIKPRKKLSRKDIAARDSLMAAHPELGEDSIMVLVAEQKVLRRMRRRAKLAADSVALAQAVAEGQEIIDYRVDSGFRKLLKRWDIRGHLTAERGRMATPYIPLKNRFKNIDLTFNTDSVMLKDMYYKMGQSDFTLNGTISNLRRALASNSYTGRAVKAELTVSSDTINVNELTQALLAGTAMANDSTLMAKMQGVNEDEDIDYELDGDSITAPFIIPRNIDATLAVSARKILYSDILFDDFTGQVLAYDGALNLRQLYASTDMGAIDVSALYSAPDRNNMQFGMGLKVHNFRLDRLTTLIPAIDSVMPMMRNFEGNVNADMALTTNLYDNMDLDLSSLAAVLKIDGDSLVLMDEETFRIASRWLFFKNKKRNMIDHLSAEIAIENNVLSLYPFMFNIDRYKLGVMGHNDMDFNLDYHVSVLKSPLPFKFGINIKGNVDDMKFSLGGAKIKENMVVERVQMADTVRVSLVEQFEKAFRRGVNAARVGRLDINAPVQEGGDAPSASEPMPSQDAVNQQEEEKTSTLDLLRQALTAIPTAGK